MGQAAVNTRHYTRTSRQLTAQQAERTEQMMLAESQRRLADPAYCRQLEQIGIEAFGDDPKVYGRA